MSKNWPQSSSSQIDFNFYLPKRHEGPYDTNEARVSVGVADKLPPHHNQYETSHHTRRRHVFSGNGNGGFRV